MSLGKSLLDAIQLKSSHRKKENTTDAGSMDLKIDTNLSEKGGKIMRKREGKKSPYMLSLLALAAFALSLQLGTVGALAQDTDKDGLPEGGLIDLTGTGLSLVAYYNNPYQIPLCATGIPRDKCVDPSTQDLFVIIKRASGCPASIVCGDPCSPTYDSSDIPMPPYDTNNLDPLALVRSGLGVTTHELVQASGYTSQAIGGYYAVKIIEDLNPCSSWMGLAAFGTFDALYTGGVATIWPEKIKNWIRQTCSVACFDLNKDGIAETCYTPDTANTFTCKNANSTTSVNMKATTPDLSKLNGELIQSLIDHEVSHLIHLASGSGTSADHHWPIATGIIMEQFIGTSVTKTTRGNISVILRISTGYTRDDKGQYLLTKP